MTRILVALLCFALPAPAADALSVNSPHGHIRFRLLLEKQGQLAYAVTLRGKAAIETSPLGMVVDGVNLAQGVQVGRTDRYKVNETYSWYGVHSTIAVRASGARIAVTHEKSGTQYTLEARAYNDGIAFRFIVPGADGKSRVPDEATTFRLPTGSTVWYHDFEGHYEGAHVRKNLQEVTALEWAAPPLTVKLPNGAGYASITEGALLHYPGMGLQADGKGGFEARLGHAHPPSYPFRLRFKDEIERMAKPASVAGVITTPWRIVMAGPI